MKIEINIEQALIIINALEKMEEELRNEFAKIKDSINDEALKYCNDKFHNIQKVRNNILNELE